MAPLVIEGNNLGERHRNYNKAVKEAILQNKSPVEDITYEDSDIENLLKIDVSCNKRDVQYILNVFKSNDMLYISRAIKQSTWLITEIQYANLINPDYLYKELFPHMMSKAVNKLLLSIRLHLKDERRVEVFFNFYKEKDFNTALKWLPLCSLPTIENIVKQKQSDINGAMLKRLCEKSLSVFEAFVYKNERYIVSEVAATVDLIYKDPARYLDILEYLHYPAIVRFGPKPTKIIMEKCPDRIFNKFEKYCGQIDVQTFVKYIKKEDIKDFVLKCFNNPSIEDWFIQKNIKYFVKELPKEERFEFLKQAFIDKSYANRNETPEMAGRCDQIQLKSYRFMSSCNPSSNSNIYKWYKFASFDVAFADLKKLIRTESSPEERNAMFNILLTCSGKNMKHLKTLLQYYKEKHINEAFKFKSQFVNNVISSTNTFRYDEATWNILNELFHCMEVYIKTENNVQSCIDCIIAYKVLHNETIPKIIEEKFTFSSMKKIRNKVTIEETKQIFKFLYDFSWKRLENCKNNTKVEFEESVRYLIDILTLLMDWDKDIKSYPDILNKIREFIKINKDNSWKVDLSELYETNKAWRRFMFEESFDLKLSEEVCINALKHDTLVLISNRQQIDFLTRNDTVSLKRLLSKLRIYYSQSLARDWLNSYKERLDTPGGHRALVLGLCALMPRRDLLSVIERFEPKDLKIVYSEADEVMLSLQKQIAKNLYTARPQPSIDTILRYAKGDYLQYTLPSVHSILNNVSPLSYRECLPKLLETPVSLQKHSIRVVLKKLKSDDLILVLSDIWKNNKNSSIRAVVFRQTFNHLCQETGSSSENIWNLISDLMNDLGSEENKEIYTSLCNVKRVPKEIQARFCMKSYKLLKELPAKMNVDVTIENLMTNSKDFVEKLDLDFVASIGTEFFRMDFGKKRLNYRERTSKMELIASYLLCGTDLKFQEEICEKLVYPMFEQVFDNLKTYSQKDEEKKLYVILNLIDFLESICQNFQNTVLAKGMTIPIHLFSEILAKLEKLDVQKNYIVLRHWKLATAFVKIMDKHSSLISELRNKEESHRENKWNVLYKAAAGNVANTFVEYLTSDTTSLFPSLYLPFATAMENVFVYFNLDQIVQLEIFKHMLEHKHSVQTYLCTFNMLPHYVNDECKELYEELRKTIFNYPSAEVKMHYYVKFSNCVDPE